MNDNGGPRVVTRRDFLPSRYGNDVPVEQPPAEAAADQSTRSSKEKCRGMATCQSPASPRSLFAGKSFHDFSARETCDAEKARPQHPGHYAACGAHCTAAAWLSVRRRQSGRTVSYRGAASRAAFHCRRLLYRQCRHLRPALLLFTASQRTDEDRVIAGRRIAA